MKRTITPTNNYKAGPGRNSLFKKSYYKLAYIAFTYGATEKEFSNSINITTETLKAWQRQNKPFSYVIKAAKINYDSVVMENSLKRSANGHFLTEIREVLDKFLGIVKLKTVKEVSPNLGAINRWLAVRHKKEWAEQAKEVNINQTKTITKTINLKTDIKEEQLANALSILFESGAITSPTNEGCVSTKVH